MIGLISLLSVGKAGTMMTGWRVQRASQAFAEELQSAFALVGRNRKPIMIQMDASAMELRITDRSGTIYRRRNFGPTSPYRLTAPDVTTSRSSVEVYPPGLAADSLSVVISRQGAYRRIRMLRGGLVQVCSNKPSASLPCQPT